MSWRVAKHVDLRREWPSLEAELTPCVEISLRALWLLYNQGDISRDINGDIDEITYSADRYLIMYWHAGGVVMVHSYGSPNRIRDLAIRFDLTNARAWNAEEIRRVLHFMRKDMMLDELASL